MLPKASMILVMLALLVAIGGCAGKKQRYATVDDVYAVYDVNQDGKITQEEFVSHFKNKDKAMTAWKKIDVNNNGFVERSLQDDTPLRVWNSVESDNIPD